MCWSRWAKPESPSLSFREPTRYTMSVCMLVLLLSGIKRICSPLGSRYSVTFSITCILLIEGFAGARSDCDDKAAAAEKAAVRTRNIVTKLMMNLIDFCRIFREANGIFGWEKSPQYSVILHILHLSTYQISRVQILSFWRRTAAHVVFVKRG